MGINWRYIDEENVDASYGLAVDEFIMSNSEKNTFDATLRLYSYKNYSALCGRFQDMNAEINIESCKSNGFQYGRRLTGGGAIIMGEQQLGICLATHTSKFNFQHSRELYRNFSEPVINVLRDLEITAGFRAKNDLEVNGKKIAGLGIYIDELGGLQFHCSLLLDLDIREMLKVLNIPIQKYSDKKLIQSIEERITTINRESRYTVDIRELKKRIKESFSTRFETSFITQPISQFERDSIAGIEQLRYLNDEWNFQRSPQKDMTGMSLLKTEFGLLRTYVGLKGENIKSVLITGDFLDSGNELNKIESELKWSLVDKKKIDAVVSRNIKSGNTNFDPGSISEAIWTAAQRAMAANRYTYKGSCYYPAENTIEKIEATGLNEINNDTI